MDEYFTSTAATYDAIVEDYERKTENESDEFKRFRTTFVDALPSHGSVLDLGCGPGRDSTYFKHHGFEVVGIDGSMGMVERARRRGVEVACADMRALPIATASVQGLWSSASLLHIPRGDVGRTLVEWRRCLAANGVLGISTSVGDSDGWEDAPYDPQATYDQPLRRWYVHHQEHRLIEGLQGAGFAVHSVSFRQSHRKWVQIVASTQP